ncbi:hypothetical protein [Streptomyces sp. NPDC020965]|uniref:hypothetical protein n=1 Tax=Streptomyces sp. NPDC020965 TaxID=3365105 RepID=UPI0037B10DD2
MKLRPVPPAARRSLTTSHLRATRRSLTSRALPPFLGWCALGATALPAATPLRVAPIALFLLAGPGLALLRVCGPALKRHRAVGPAASRDTGFDRDSDRIERLVLAVLLSLSAVVVVATALIAMREFSGPRVLVLLTLLTMLAACCPQLPSHGRQRCAATAAPSRKGSSQKG